MEVPDPHQRSPNGIAPDGGRSARNRTPDNHAEQRNSKNAQNFHQNMPPPSSRMPACRVHDAPRSLREMIADLPAAALPAAGARCATPYSTTATDKRFPRFVARATELVHFFGPWHRAFRRVRLGISHQRACPCVWPTTAAGALVVCSAAVNAADSTHLPSWDTIGRRGAASARADGAFRCAQRTLRLRRSARPWLCTTDDGAHTGSNGRGRSTVRG
jgi:hypothetical protein